MIAYRTYYASPLGLIEIRGTADAITTLAFVEREIETGHSHALVQEARRQLEAYFQGELQVFDLPLAPAGTEFQLQVWAEVRQVPYGSLQTYHDIAVALNNPAAVRAVGAANGQNPIAIIIPCHRILGSDGSLTGYRGGTWRKEWLLRHEGSILI